jgi:hypothetical protein
MASSSNSPDRGAAASAAASLHVALLGDSIFDNRAYTGGAPDVVSHLRALLSSHGTATLCARDGATTQTIATQFACVPAAATHLFVSVGGNDALANQDLLSMRVASTGEALNLFARRLDQFERAYRKVVAEVLALKRPTTLCTIYNGALEEPMATPARIALTLFNDAILRTAVAYRVNVVELRLVCTELPDYVNAIEPSGAGGLKIARAIAAAVELVAPTAAASRVFGAG